MSRCWRWPRSWRIALCVTAFLLRRHKMFPVAVMIAATRGGLCGRDLENRADLPWRAGAADVFGVADGFCRDPRHPRAHRPLRAARRHDGERARTDKLERVRLSVKKGTAPAVGSFVELKARLLPPLAPLRPGSYDFGRDMFFSGHRRLRLRDGRDQGGGAA